MINSPIDPVMRAMLASQKPQTSVEDLRAENALLKARLARYKAATKRQFMRLKAKSETLENLLRGKLSRELRKAVIETLKERFNG